MGSGDPVNSPKAVYKITETWKENNITWLNPADFDATAIDQNSNTSVKVWEDYDVTSVIKDIVENGADNFGFLVKFPSETDYKGARIHSSEYSDDESLRPKLSITYDKPTGISTTQFINRKQITWKFTPEAYFVNIPFPEDYTVVISDTKGRQLSSFKTSKQKEWYTIPFNLSSGVHFISLRNSEEVITRRFLIAK